MFNNDQIIQLGLETAIAFVREMSFDQLKSENIVAVIADLADPMLNVVLHFDSSEDNIDENLSAIRHFYAQYNASWFCMVGSATKPATLGQYLLRQGLTLEETYPSMYFDLSNDFLQTLDTDFIIRESLDANLNDWVLPLREAFPSSDRAESYRQLNGRLPHGPQCKLRHFVGYYKNKPVTAGTLFLSEHACMIHNIGTLPALRYRGFGTAMVLHLMREAKQLGIKHCFLDASESGLSVYKKIGFVVYARTRLYKATIR